MSHKYTVKVLVVSNGQRMWTSFQVDVRDPQNAYAKAKAESVFCPGDFLWDEAVLTS